MAPRAKARGLELSFEIRPGVPATLVGDPNRLRQILINLLGNALKFTERGSVKLTVEPDAEGFRFTVADTGIGIAADKRELIFDNFTQADSSTTRKYGGTGLGLAISRGLAELMGGRMGCESEPGQGSRFFLVAPFRVQEEPAAEVDEPEVKAAAAMPASGAQGVQPILIAEDSEDNLLLIKAYLKDCGFELLTVDNGALAVEEVMAGKARLVLMDLEMPVMDGLAATRAIRRWEAETGAIPIPILALTAHAGQEGVGRSLKAGCNEHLTKPIKKAALVAAISRYMGGKIRVTPPQEIEELVPKYLANVRRYMEEILAGVESKDCNIARRLGHQFKGSGNGYGFPEIARSGAAIETAAIAQDEDEIRRQLMALAAYLNRVEVVIKDPQGILD
jgi:CheY-like chemotaxis protein